MPTNANYANNCYQTIKLISKSLLVRQTTHRESEREKIKEKMSVHYVAKHRAELLSKLSNFWLKLNEIKF